jgi:hypothetical protein
MHLRQPGLIDLAPSLVGVPIVRTPIGIQGTEEPLRLHDLPEASEAAQGPFFLDEEARIDLRRRIVQRHNQIPLTAGRTHSWVEPSWCSIIPGSGLRGRFLRCAPRRGARATCPAACRVFFVQL